MKKNPFVAALLGLLVNFFAYLYVWKLGRFFIVMSAYVVAAYISDLSGSPTVSLLVLFVFSAFVSYDCWRIVKLESKEITLETNEITTESKEITKLSVNQVAAPKKPVMTSQDKQVMTSQDKQVMTSQDKQVMTSQDKPVMISRDIYCPQCKISLAIPYPICPNCGAKTLFNVVKGQINPSQSSR